VIKIPREAPIMALPNAVLFPHSLLPLHIFELRYRRMLESSLSGDRMFSVALVKPGVSEVNEIEDLYPIAGMGLIRACVENENGTSNLILQGLARVRLVSWTQEEPFRKAQIELVETSLGDSVEAYALSAKVKELCQRLQSVGVTLPANLKDHLRRLDEPEIIGDVIAAAFVGEPEERQHLLQISDICERLRALIQLLRS
jgi:Lon protease-like protein